MSSTAYIRILEANTVSQLESQASSLIRHGYTPNGSVSVVNYDRTEFKYVLIMLKR